jgi:redox-sensitive bicupin YhaK (pirin superfamily)
MKNITGIYRNEHMHWVGDGFPVRNLFSYDRFQQAISPFLLLDYAAPYTFAPSKTPKGVGQHPHKGFETVTIAYQGEVAHQDSSGAGGIIQAGDVQWMTAGNGVFHEEFHSPAFSQRGGIFEMVQLWVNLPKAHKGTPARYQGIQKADIPVIDLSGGTLRVIAGDYQTTTGPAKTFSPVNVWDVALTQGSTEMFTLPEGHNAIVVLLQGKLRINGLDSVSGSAAITLSTAGEKLRLEAQANSQFLILTGEPLNEPIAGYGPFVMNTHQELLEAFETMYQ